MTRDKGLANQGDVMLNGNKCRTMMQTKTMFCDSEISINQILVPFLEQAHDPSAFSGQ